MIEEELAVVRRAFAQQVVAAAGVAGNAALEDAFRSVRRERFLGTDTWQIVDFARMPTALPSNDPVYAYQDVLFVLSSWRGANNGRPSLHARLLTALSPEAGQIVAHLGAGTGYYSAILAHLVGPHGRVMAIELDEVLARTAQTALSDFANVEVIVDDAAKWPREKVDCIYVNFAVLAPQERWIEQLASGGRLVIPLGVPGQSLRPAGPRFSRHGAAFLIQRKETGFSASHICPAYFVHADGNAGNIEKVDEERLRNAFQGPGAEFVRSFIWRSPADPAVCWVSAPQWSLCYDPVE